MRIYWEVDDGYAGKSRPQYTDIDNNELDECETEEEKQELITEYVQDDFDNRITWYFTD